MEGAATGTAVEDSNCQRRDDDSSGIQELGLKEVMMMMTMMIAVYRSKGQKKQGVNCSGCCIDRWRTRGLTSGGACRFPTEVFLISKYRSDEVGSPLTCC